MPGLFDLISADDLCAKLDHDYRRLSESPSDVFVAFDFIVTAWHLLEWRFPGNAGRATRDRLLAEHPVLALCEHLCVSGKHFAPTNPNLRSVSGTFRNSVWKRGMWAPGAWAKGFWKDELVIDLTGPAKETYGPSISMSRFAELVVEFWRGPGGCPLERSVSGAA